MFDIFFVAVRDKSRACRGAFSDIEQTVSFCAGGRGGECAEETACTACADITCGDVGHFGDGDTASEHGTEIIARIALNAQDLCRDHGTGFPVGFRDAFEKLILGSVAVSGINGDFLDSFGRLTKRVFRNFGFGVGILVVLRFNGSSRLGFLKPVWYKDGLIIAWPVLDEDVGKKSCVRE